MIEIETAVGLVRAHAHARFLPGSAVLVGVRPERIVIGETKVNQPKANRIEAVLADGVFLGAKVRLVFDAPEGGHILAEISALPAGARPGAQLTLSWDVDDTLVYPLPGGAS
jgi:putative spermidine/putrescine transport system ATP-binding protein